MLFLCFNFFLFGILSFIWIFNRDRIFGFYYMSLFLYSFVPFAARIYDNDLVTGMSHVNIEGKALLIKYVLFSMFFMIFTVLFFYLIIARPYNVVHRIRFSIPDIKGGLYIYIIISFIVFMYLGINLIKNYSSMSYFNQISVKGNIIWYLLLEYVIVFFSIDMFYFFNKANNRINRYILLFLGIIKVLLLLITCSRIGNRGILLPGLLGLLFCVTDKFNFKFNLRLKHIKNIFKVSFVCVLIIAFSQYIRTNRGYNYSTNNISFNEIFSFFNLNSILFQDYTYPGNGLMYIIQNDIISPTFVILSNIYNAIFLFDYDTVAVTISRLIAPNMWFGIGGFIETESYFSLGWIGAVIYPLIISVAWRMYSKSICNVANTRYRRFFGFLMVTFLSINLVRSQSYMLIKVSYMYFIPSIFLYKLANGSIKSKKINYGEMS